MSEYSINKGQISYIFVQIVLRFLPLQLWMVRARFKVSVCVCVYERGTVRDRVYVCASNSMILKFKTLIKSEDRQEVQDCEHLFIDFCYVMTITIQQPKAIKSHAKVNSSCKTEHHNTEEETLDNYSYNKLSVFCITLCACLLVQVILAANWMEFNFFLSNTVFAGH